MNRWIVYQRERFPLAAHAPLVAAFSASAVCFSSRLRGRIAFPPPGALLVAFVTALLFFLQLRIADEFKDRDIDARYRPYRPVPRGLVSLRELGWIAAGAAVIQAVLAVVLDASMLWILAAAWIYLALMTREFFAGTWLRRRPVVYAASHMLILPFVDLYATACDWWRADHRAPRGLCWFLAVSYLNGLVIEVGRKTRASADEEHGVETYSALWGATSAARVWVLAVAATAFAAWRAAGRIDAAEPMSALLLALIVACAVTANAFVKSDARGGGRRLELMSAVWTICMYLGLGAAPLAVLVWRSHS